MNHQQVFKQLGVVVLLLGLFMLSSLIWAVLDHQPGHFDGIFTAILSSVAVCIAVGLGMYLPCRKNDEPIYRREAIAIVGLTWLAAGLLGALPYICSGVMTGQFSGPWSVFCAATFESVSGFSCAGSSVFASPEDLPRAILFWRSLTHWLGGMGIVVLFVAVLGHTGKSAKFLFSAEVPGPISESAHPRVRQAALLLWKIYLLISLAMTCALCAQGMSLFDSLCHTFGAMATGGFSTRNASITAFESWNIELTVIIFMLLAATNFNIHAAMLRGRWRAALANRELWIFLSILAVAIALVTLDIRANQADRYSFIEALRSAGFNVVSIMSTTGFGLGDFDSWPNFSRYLMLMLMFVGASSGSTSGAIKVIRFILFVRIIKSEIERAFRPHVVRPLKVGGLVIEEDLRRNICIYIALHIGVALVATQLLLALHNSAIVADPAHHLDITSAFSAVAATLNGVGPGLNLVGATENFAFFTGAAKLLLSLLMILGRLEIIAILCLFLPSFWRRD